MTVAVMILNHYIMTATMTRSSMPLSVEIAGWGLQGTGRVGMLGYPNPHLQNPGNPRIIVNGQNFGC